MITIDKRFKNFQIKQFNAVHSRNIQSPRIRSAVRAMVTKEALKFSPELYCNSPDSFDLFTEYLRRKFNITKKSEQFKQLKDLYLSNAASRMDPQVYLGDVRPITFGVFHPDKPSLMGGFHLYGIKIINQTDNTLLINTFIHTMFGEYVQDITPAARARISAEVMKTVLLHDFVTVDDLYTMRINILEYRSPADYSKIIDDTARNWIRSYLRAVETELTTIANGEIEPVDIPNVLLKGFKRV